MFEIRLIGRRARAQERGGVASGCAVNAGIVVLNFVIVPADDEWKRGMGGGKMRIGAIKRMSRAVIVKAMRHRRSEGADIRSIAEGLFVDIIPDLKNRLDLLRDPEIGRPSWRERVCQLV